MAVGAVELADRLAIPIQTKPCQAFQNCLCRLWGRTFAVGILDPQQEFAAPPACVKPVEQSRSRPPICRYPVGEGAKRVTTGIWDIWVLTFWKPSERHAWIGSRQGQGIGQGWLSPAWMTQGRALAMARSRRPWPRSAGGCFCSCRSVWVSALGFTSACPWNRPKRNGVMACRRNGLPWRYCSWRCPCRCAACHCLPVGWRKGARWLGGAPIAFAAPVLELPLLWPDRRPHREG